MEVNEILRILEEMNVAVIATAEENNQPHAGHTNLVVEKKKGVFLLIVQTIKTKSESCYYCYEERRLLNPSNSY